MDAELRDENTPARTLQLTEAEFDEQFHPIGKPDDEGLLDWADVKDLPPTLVWTVVETGHPLNDSWYALPGIHIVNRIGYLRSETPWAGENMEAMWSERFPELDEYDPHQQRCSVLFPTLGEIIHITRTAGTVSVVNGDGEDVSTDIRDLFDDVSEYAYLTEEYPTLVDDAYRAALDGPEGEPYAAARAATEVPVVRPA